jgi:GDPmannose 4,6-dehydratase
MPATASCSITSHRSAASHARDYVRAQWLMLQQDAPDDYVIATGQQYSVRHFVETAAARLGMAIEWHGEGVDEIGVIGATGKPIVRIDPRYFRPTEVETLLGDASKARTELGWEPEVDFQNLVKEMVSDDLLLAERDALVAKEGYTVFSHNE